MSQNCRVISGLNVTHLSSLGRGKYVDSYLYLTSVTAGHRTYNMTYFTDRAFSSTFLDKSKGLSDMIVKTAEDDNYSPSSISRKNILENCDLRSTRKSIPM